MVNIVERVTGCVLNTLFFRSKCPTCEKGRSDQQNGFLEKSGREGKLTDIGF
jgi:hypothetical protein